MNFFEQQTLARRHTTQLLVLFGLAIFLLATGIYFAARGALGVIHMSRYVIQVTERFAEICEVSTRQQKQ